MLIRFHLNNGEILTDRVDQEYFPDFIKWYLDRANEFTRQNNSNPLWVTHGDKIIHLNNVCYIEEKT